jgi:hypothetical protein
VAGVILLVAGLVFLALGLQSFFSAFGNDDPDAGFPSRFWMVFVGVLLIAPAGWCLQAGFLGAAARYAAGEPMPTVKDSAAYLTDGEGVLGIGRTVDDEQQPQRAATGPFCSTCGTRNDADASYCDACGAALAH